MIAGDCDGDRVSGGVASSIAQSPRAFTDDVQLTLADGLPDQKCASDGSGETRSVDRENDSIDQLFPPRTRSSERPVYYAIKGNFHRGTFLHILLIDTFCLWRPRKSTHLLA